MLDAVERRGDHGEEGGTHDTRGLWVLFSPGLSTCFEKKDTSA
jgi:hypothetical protein